MSAATTSPSARHWAQYLVDKGLVKSGDFVWMPVEVPGATYGVQEEEGIASVFEPLGITWEVTDATLDQAEIITRMVDYLTANRTKIKAIIGLGDLVTGSVKRVFDQVGVKPGEIPVVGWGNSLDTTQEVLTGYVNAAQWQDPQATSYIALSLAAMAAGGIPAGLQRHHRRALREGHRAGLRRHPVRQVSSAIPTARGGHAAASMLPLPAAGRRVHASMLTLNRVVGSLGKSLAPSAPDRQARIRAVRAPRRRDRRLLAASTPISSRPRTSATRWPSRSSSA